MNTPKTRSSDYVCVECGVKYLTEDQKKESYATTFYTDTCGLCEQEKAVTSIRHYNYLNKPS